MHKLGGLEMEQSLRTDPLNSYEMDKRWFLNWSLQSLNESRNKSIVNCNSQSFSLLFHLYVEVASERFMEDIWT